MPQVSVLLYKGTNDECPVLDFLAGLQEKPYAKCQTYIELLREEGHALRRPYADYLRDGIYELRVRWGTVNIRLLYFFYGGNAVVLSHGFTKEDQVPPTEIERAVERKARFEADPERHALQE